MLWYGVVLSGGEKMVWRCAVIDLLWCSVVQYGSALHSDTAWCNMVQGAHVWLIAYYSTFIAAIDQVYSPDVESVKEYKYIIQHINTVK